MVSIEVHRVHAVMSDETDHRELAGIDLGADAQPLSLDSSARQGGRVHRRGAPEAQRDAHESSDMIWRRTITLNSGVPLPGAVTSLGIGWRAPNRSRTHQLIRLHRPALASPMPTTRGSRRPKRIVGPVSQRFAKWRPLVLGRNRRRHSIWSCLRLVPGRRGRDLVVSRATLRDVGRRGRQRRQRVIACGGDRPRCLSQRDLGRRLGRAAAGAASRPRSRG